MSGRKSRRIEIALVRRVYLSVRRYVTASLICASVGLGESGFIPGHGPYPSWRSLLSVLRERELWFLQCLQDQLQFAESCPTRGARLVSIESVHYPKKYFLRVHAR